MRKGAPIVGAGLNSKLLGTTTRRDGSLQVTYNNHPLSFFEGDMRVSGPPIWSRAK